ncbi:Long-chain-fatty-acid--CoA ligase FadD15 [Serratia odorifera]|uniref:Long-chain-fatty-acid--CoA ligase FadD15 n=1 Tax=Serratia odorifera TaxID=618 RepID=A0A3S5D6V0_SEROD|nr:Long-chain-fatty-acid--CoA ligase FadD15 [Serratia odorifera]
MRGCDIARYLSHIEREADVEQHHACLTERIAGRDLQDLFTLIYTSGTTGEPKGVMLDYRNMAAQLYLHDQRLTVDADDVSLSFLPLSHVFERAWSFFIMHSGAQNVFLPNTDWVRDAMAAVRPSVMCAVPRFYEKIYSAVHEKVARAPWWRRKLFHWAIGCGERKFLQERAARPIGKTLALAHRWADKLVLEQAARHFRRPGALFAGGRRQTG